MTTSFEIPHHRHRSPLGDLLATGGGPWSTRDERHRKQLYSDPVQGGYQSSEIFKVGQDIGVLIDGVEHARIAVADILP